jgi:2-polyprenyl-3-methyl-5-hydroxy-6-metoxy-1,4-benzoquinol methylase
LAYASYYTHQEAGVKDEYASLSMLRKVRRCLVNGYTNWRFSTNAMPSSAMGVPVVFVIPKLKKLIDQQYRHLPRLPKGGGRLLDVGCGDGSFLRHARNCGWDVVGLDPDTKAVANAAKHGLVVHQGGIELFRDQFELFDVITLNHVIEHVHDPVVLLKACHSLLKHGGQLWLSTPNIDSFGHYRFQKNWRGLETPRHLVIFNRRSLNRAFIAAGFLAPTDRACVSPCKGMFNMSSAMEQGHTHNEIIDPPLTVKLQTWMAELGEMVLPSRREFLIVSTRKAVS